jgi:beta-1,3-glucuronyltransferase
MKSKSVRFSLTAPMPKEEQKKKVKARGVSNRNRGLQWIRENNVDPDGVIYFADDDNTYDLRLFEEVSQ